ncbi:MAG TPA: hypothetical protein VN822_11585 [Candidatus Acidoferrales bacterium]|nr:hypothetical protein [Candidatus Acidoferrales bacterium]
MQFAQPNTAETTTLAPARNDGTHRLAFRVGGTCFDLVNDGDVPLTLDPGLRDFAVEPGSDGGVKIQVDWTDELDIPARAPLFDSGGLWSLFEESGGYRFYFSTPFLGATPYKAAWFDPEFRHGHVVLFRPYFDAARPVYPLEYPLDELLMIHRLACGGGVEVHAVGVVDEAGRGHLFLGHSGAGKSTTARLWMERPNVRILSDDRIILRVRDGRIWMHGTPWHGDAGIASPDAAPVSQIYLLEHSQATELIPVSPGRTAAELFARSFVPHHSPKGVQFTLGFLDRVARRIPCAVFRFRPDGSAVEAISRAGA